LKVDLTGVALDEAFPENRLPPVETLAGERSFHEIVRSHIDAGATLREILRVTDGAVDGFNINPAITPNGLTDFVDHVVPLLQAKGIYKREYSAAGSRQA